MNFSRPISWRVFCSSFQSIFSTTTWVAIPAWSLPGTQRVVLPFMRFLKRKKKLPVTDLKSKRKIKRKKNPFWLIYFYVIEKVKGFWREVIDILIGYFVIIQITDSCFFWSLDDAECSLAANLFMTLFPVLKVIVMIYWFPTNNNFCIDFDKFEFYSSIF